MAVVIVTGAGAGIGKATALEFARQGDHVVACDIQLATAQATIAEAHGSNHLAIRCDVSQQADVNAMVAQAYAHYGRIDVLVNNTGI